MDQHDPAGAHRADRLAPIGADVIRTLDPELTDTERRELARLRKENRELKAEREFLGKAAAFFAKEYR